MGRTLAWWCCTLTPVAIVCPPRACPPSPHLDLSRRQLCLGRFSATGTSSSRCAYPTARPVAIRPLCDNNDNKKKSNGSPGHGCTWELALPLLLARRHAELGQTAPPAARVGQIPASASSNDLPSERRGATPADAQVWCHGCTSGQRAPNFKVPLRSTDCAVAAIRSRQRRWQHRVANLANHVGKP